MLYINFNSSKKIDLNMECNFSTHFKRWIPIKIVNDKPYKKEDIYLIESNYN